MRKTLLLCALLIAFVSSCIMDYTNEKLSVTNKSGKDISVLYSNDAEIAENGNNVAFYIADWEVIKPDSSKSIAISGKENAWHHYIEDGSAKKLYFYIFETDTLRKYKNVYSMRGFVQMNKYFKVLNFSEDELKKINWNIAVGN